MAVSSDYDVVILGDAIGYKNGKWEFNKSGAHIQEQVEQLGGVRSLTNIATRW